MGHQVVDQQRYRAAGSAFGLAGVPGGAGNVQVGPAVVFGKAAQETGSCDGACRTAADVGDIRKVAVELALVLVPQGQAPGTVAGAFTGGQQFAGQLLVVGQQAGGVMAQGNNAGAGQGCHVDNGFRVVLLHVGEGITQDQPAFGVGVEDFDGLATEGGDDIAGAGRTAVRHVFGRRDNRHHVDRGSGLGQDFHGAKHAGGTAHVVLHLIHAFAGLETDPAGVKGDALTHQNVRPVFTVAAAVLHHNQARRVDRAFTHRQNGVHAQLFHVFFVKHFNAETLVLFADSPGLLSQPHGVTDVGRGVAQVFGVVHAPAGGQAKVEGDFQRAVSTGRLDRYFAELVVFRLFAFVATEGIELVFQRAADQIQAGWL